MGFDKGATYVIAAHHEVTLDHGLRQDAAFLAAADVVQLELNFFVLVGDVVNNDGTVGRQKEENVGGSGLESEPRDGRAGVPQEFLLGAAVSGDVAPE